MVLNLTSKQMESRLGKALELVAEEIKKEFEIQLHHDPQWKLRDIIDRLKPVFGDVSFHLYKESSSMRPDGGILSLVDAKGIAKYPILITEVKKQGTNAGLINEGKKKQAKGNAIERLGKNVIGFRTALRTESIFPFLCFGEGCDFSDDSSILDRVSTIAMFGKLNEIRVVNEGPDGLFNRGSFFFREEEWSTTEMKKQMLEVATRSIHYYIAKYGESHFIL